MRDTGEVALYEKSSDNISDTHQSFRGKTKLLSCNLEMTIMSPVPTTDWSHGAMYQSNISCSNIKDLSQPQTHTQKRKNNEMEII